MTTSLFFHTPLDLSRQEIRLIRLLDDDSTASVRLQIQHFEVGSPAMPDYWALSYTWGPPLWIFAVEINACRYPVRENLQLFLLEARRRRLNEWLWIDQLCIAQESTTERNHQVSMMGLIYSRAKIVLIWLGDPGTADPEVLSRWLATSAKEASPKEFRDDGIRLSDAHPAVGVALQTFCSNSYWRRVWIIQELLLARSKAIWWGQHSMELEIIKVLNDEGMDYSTNAELVRTYGPVYYRLYATAEPKDFSELVIMMSSCMCENPRDFVYGVKEVVRHSSHIEVDYHKSTVDVFHDAVALLMVEGYASGSFDVKARSRFQYAYSVLKSHMLPWDSAVTETIDDEGTGIHDHVFFNLRDFGSKSLADRYALYAHHIAEYRRLKAQHSRNSWVKECLALDLQRRSEDA